MAETTRTLALALSPAMSPERRPVKERREALAAWLDDMEAKVKERLRKLKLPDDLAGLEDHLPSLFNPKIKPPSPPDKNVDEYQVAIRLVKGIRLSPKYQQGNDLLCCLACLCNCRALLKRREPELIAFQVYVLGARMQSAGLRMVSMTGQQVHQGGHEGGTARWGGKKVIEERHWEWQRRVDELHRRRPNLSWTALADKVAAQPQKSGQKVTGRTIRSACNNPHKETGK